MDWSNERYVRVYVRDTPDWLLWGWEARALLVFLLRKVDRAGVLEVGKHGVRGVAATVGMPVEATEPALRELTDDGVVEMRDGVLVIPNYIEAQEANQSDKQRAKESRARRRDRSRRGVTEDDDGVTNCDGDASSRDESVTGSHTESQPVTPCRAVPCQSSTPQSPPAGGEGSGQLSLSGEPEGQRETRAAKARAFAWAGVCELNSLMGKRYDPRGKQVTDDAKKLVRDGYTPDEARAVVRAKTRQWGRDPEKSENLKPGTLFRPGNFRRYVENDVTQADRDGAPSASGVAPEDDPLERYYAEREAKGEAIW